MKTKAELKQAALAALLASEFQHSGSAGCGGLRCYVQRVQGFSKKAHYRYTFKLFGKVVSGPAV